MLRTVVGNQTPLCRLFESNSDRGTTAQRPECDELIKVEIYVMNAKALSIMRYQDDINTEHNMKSICCAAVAQWTKRLTRNGYTRVRI